MSSFALSNVTYGARPKIQMYAGGQKLMTQEADQSIAVKGERTGVRIMVVILTHGPAAVRRTRNTAKAAAVIPMDIAVRSEQSSGVVRIRH